MSKILINSDRLKKELEYYSTFGGTANGGVTRLTLSQEDILARDYFRSSCEEIGLNVKVDDMGCMYATLEGSENNLPITIGSHLDSVENGGKFDGALGVIGGLELLRTIIEHGIKPKTSITLINFTNEEGVRFRPTMMGSGVLTKKFDREKMLKEVDANNVTFKEALTKSGYLGARENRLQKAAAYLELHIEQGPALSEESISIGVVEGVKGMVCYEIEVTGESNHAGTTPMHFRKDALGMANDLLNHFQTEFESLDNEFVYTIGRFDVEPNVHTIIPNKVVFTFEARHNDPEVLAFVEQVIKDLPIKSNTLEISSKKLWDRSCVAFDKKICKTVEAAVKSLDYSYKKMESGAGHDAQFVADIIPTAMIFIPSIKGKSHSPEELSDWDDCARGVNVLLETVLNLAN